MATPSERSKKFQWVLIGIFGVFAIVAVFMFASVRGTSSNVQQTGPMVVWGTLPSDVFNTAAAVLGSAGASEVSYVRIPEEDFHRTLTEAIASGKGPDLILIDDQRFLLEAPTLTPISYERIPERTFRDTFIDGGELFLTKDGVYALPVLVDPLVLYYNRDHLASAGIAVTPKFWDEFLTLAPTLTQKTEDSRIIRSTIALGEYQNITHAKEILATLMMQAGSSMVTSGVQGLESRILSGEGGGSSPAIAALRFYTEFSNPVKTVYSWNRSLAASKQAFLAGDLTFYLGYASEVSMLRRGNPNLNLDVIPMPQSRQALRKSVYGRVYALAVPRGAAAPLSSLALAQIMVGMDVDAALAEHSMLAPARRDLLSAQQTNAFLTTLYQSAIMSKPWLDPEPEQTEGVFARMVGSVTSGAATLDQAARTANDQIDALLH